MLSTTSAFEGPFDFRVLELLTGLGEDELLDALDAVLAAGLVQPAARADAYEFVHELVRRTLYDELNPSRRARLHRRIARALETLGSESAAELAIQYALSSTLPGAANGIPYALAAARGAERERFLAIAEELAWDADESVRAEIRAQRADGRRPDGLTRREVEVLRLVALGRSTKEIARELVLSAHTVDRHIANIYGKIGAHNRAAATAHALATGVLQT